MIQKWIEDVSFMAHGYCLLWDPRLLFLHAGSDLVIALCYFAIPGGIWYYLRKRPDLELKGLAWLFVAFIALCGFTHLIGLITLWNPIYVTQGAVKFMTATASVLTAISLIQILPQALAIPSPAQLQAVNQQLNDEVEAHRSTLDELEQAKSLLEGLVASRTKELEDVTRQFQQLFEESPAAMFMTNTGGKIEKMNLAAVDLFGYENKCAIEKNLSELLPELDFGKGNPLHVLKKGLKLGSSAATGRTFLGKKDNGDEFPSEVRANSMAVGKTNFFIVSVFDVSERENRQKQIELLMAEVNHRANNLLTVVQSVARQTARISSGEEFADKLTKRLHSLSASQDLIISGDWKRVDLDKLVKRQLDFLGELGAERCKVGGPALKLTPQAAQGIGMAIHELATNSLKYGALSTSNGRVEVSWTLKETDKQQGFEIVWQEHGGPKVTQPKRHGFGTTVIERMAASAVDGNVDLTYNASGIEWRLTACLGQSVFS